MPADGLPSLTGSFNVDFISNILSYLRCGPTNLWASYVYRMMAAEEKSRNWLNGSEGQKEGRRVEADLKVERKPK
jgi:hypothetical protein